MGIRDSLYTALMQKLGEMPRSQAADPGRSGTSPAKEDNGKNKTLKELDVYKRQG